MNFNDNCYTYIVGLRGSYVQSSQSVSPFRKWNRVQDLLLLKKRRMKEAITSKDFCLQPKYTASPLQAIHFGQNIMKSHFEILCLYDLIEFVWKLSFQIGFKNRKVCFLAVWKSLGLLSTRKTTCVYSNIFYSSKFNFKVNITFCLFFCLNSIMKTFLNINTGMCQRGGRGGTCPPRFWQIRRRRRQAAARRITVCPPRFLDLGTCLLNILEIKAFGLFF